MDDREEKPAKRWERLLGVGEMLPRDPTDRVGWLLEATPDAPDHLAASLLMVLVHAGTALRCRRAVLEVVPPAIGMGAIRFSLGRGTTEPEIREVAERLELVLAAGVGALSPAG